MEKQFLVSVVIPIYNTEKYLEETIQSIVNQTLDFEQNIQIILVNDCSTDRCDKICEKYKALYPGNVEYIYSAENRGVSAARNEGMKYAVGKYINFLDSDDLWSLNAYQQAVAFLDKNDKEIDIVSADIESFDAYYEQHGLNLNCVSNTIIDLDKQYTYIRSNGPACIIKREVARQYCFNEQQTCWEDTVYINQILLRRRRYGMLSSDVRYFYRRRRENSSATQAYGKSKRYYLYELKLLFDGIYKESIKQCGNFVPMAQYLIAYAFGYRFLDTAKILTNSEKKCYDDLFLDIIQHIEDKYLLVLCNADDMTKKAMAAYKHSIDMRDEIRSFQETRAHHRWIQQCLDRTGMNYEVLKKWFLLHTQGKTIASYFNSNGYKSIAVYGMAELGRYLISELRTSAINIRYGIDRRAEILKAEVPILTIEDELPEVDVVVVTAVFYYDQIAEGLLNRIECPVVSLEDILYNVSTG